METIERDYSGGGSGLTQLPTPKPGSVGEVIAKAMRYLDENGWCQFVARNNKGEACGHGSIGEAAFKECNAMPSYIELKIPDLLLGSDGFTEIARIPNPEKELVFSAAVEAHKFLMQAAIKEGWDSEGGFLDFTGKPYKDAFAVFNDDPNTTVEDVKLMMKSAIELANEAGM